MTHTVDSLSLSLLSRAVFVSVLSPYNIINCNLEAVGEATPTHTYTDRHTEAVSLALITVSPGPLLTVDCDDEFK